MRIVFTLLFTLLASSATAFAQPISFFVDDFTNTQGGIGDFISDSSPPDVNAAWANFGSFPAANTIGGRRTLGNYLLFNNSGGVGNTNITAGAFRIANTDNANSAGQITWDGTATTPTGPIPGAPSGMSLGKDVVAGVSNNQFYFEFSVLNRDFRTWTYTVRAYTTATDYFERVITTTIGGNGNFSQSVSLLNTTFTSVNTPDWTNINAITFAAQYDSNAEGLGADLSINFVRFIAVPEMSAYLMMGLSALLVGAVYAYRRGSKGQAKTEEVEATSETPEGIPALIPVTVN